MTPTDHPPWERLEEYCRGRVSGAQLEEIENHLLVCHDCQDGLEEAERYIRAMGAAAAKLAAEDEQRRKRRGAWLNWRLSPMAAAAVLAVVILAAAVTVLFTQRSVRPTPVAVVLAISRGERNLQHARARTPLLITLDLAGVTPLHSYYVKIVDSKGAAVVECAGRRSAERLGLDTPVTLGPGTYWVRVFDRAATSTPLREFGLEVD